jgi:uncharacterized membrane protein YczE
MRDRWFGRSVVRRLPGLVGGLVLFGIAVALMARAGIGLSPWETFHQGISRMTGIPMGTVSIVLGLPILLLWIPLGARPGLGTLLNVIIIGSTTNLLLPLLPGPQGPAAQAAMFGLGLACVSIGSGMYLSADLGPGPRDGLFTAVHHRTGWRIAYVRTAIEVSVLAAGFLLGGTVGIGTLVFALSIGHLTEWSLRIFDREGRIMHKRIVQEAEPIPMEGAA